MSKKRKNSVQQLLGIKTFTNYGLETNKGELLMFMVAPTNISVLSPSAIEIKVHHLMMLLSSIPDIEISCTDAAECFDYNKSYLHSRSQNERNRSIRGLLEKDIKFLDEIQIEMSTSRQFMFVARLKKSKDESTFQTANRIEKTISEQGFEVHRMTKEDIKRMIALYLGTSLYGESIADVDGEQYFRKEV